jgi:hypothetical protein
MSRRLGRWAGALPALPIETEECRTFVDWTRRVQFAGEPLFERVVKIANERGQRGAQTAILTAIGLRKGFLDYAIHAPYGRIHGLYLEAKRRDGGHVPVEQTDWVTKLRAWGYHAAICAGAEEMIYVTRSYMRISGALDDGVFIDRTVL